MSASPGRGRRCGTRATAETAAATALQRAVSSAAAASPSFAVEAGAATTGGAATAAAPPPTPEASLSLSEASRGPAEFPPAANPPPHTTAAGPIILLDNAAAATAPAAGGARELAVPAAAAPTVQTGVPAANTCEATAAPPSPDAAGPTAASSLAEGELVWAAGSCEDVAAYAATTPADLVEVLDAAVDCLGGDAAAETFQAATLCPPPSSAAGGSPSAPATAPPATTGPEAAAAEAASAKAAAAEAAGIVDYVETGAGNASAAANPTPTATEDARRHTAARLSNETAGLTVHASQEVVLVISDDEAAYVATEDSPPSAAASPSSARAHSSPPPSPCSRRGSIQSRSSSSSQKQSSSSDSSSSRFSCEAASSTRCSGPSSFLMSHASSGGPDSSSRKGERIYEWSEAQGQFVRRSDLEECRAEDIHFCVPDTCFIIDSEQQQQHTPLQRLLQQHTPPLPPWLQFFRCCARRERTSALPVACGSAGAASPRAAAGAAPQVASSVASGISPLHASAAAVSVAAAAETPLEQQVGGDHGLLQQQQKPQVASSLQQVSVTQVQQQPQQQVVLHASPLPAGGRSAASATCSEASSSTSITVNSSGSGVGIREVEQLWQQVLADVAAYRRWQREKKAATRRAAAAAEQQQQRTDTAGGAGQSLAHSTGENAAAAAGAAHTTSTAAATAAMHATSAAYAEKGSHVATEGLSVASESPPSLVTTAAASPTAAAAPSLAAAATGTGATGASATAETVAEERVLPWQPRCGQERGQFYAAWARLPAGCSPSPAHARQYWQQLLQDVDRVEALRLLVQQGQQQQPCHQEQQQKRQQEKQQQQQNRQWEQRQKQQQEHDGTLCLGQVQVKKRRQEGEVKQQLQLQLQQQEHHHSEEGGLHRRGAGVLQSPISRRSTWTATGGGRQQLLLQVADAGRPLQQKSLLHDRSATAFSLRAPAKAGATRTDAVPTQSRSPAAPGAFASCATASAGAAAATASGRASAVAPAAGVAAGLSFRAPVAAAKRQRLGGGGEEAGGGEAAAAKTAGGSGPHRPAAYVPLAERLRPRSLQEFLWHGSLVEHDSRGTLKDLIQTGQLPSLILWGPPGCGKTTLALLAGRALNCFASAAASSPAAGASSTGVTAAAAAAHEAPAPSESFTHMSATACGVNDIKKVVQQAAQLRRTTGQKAILFLDEIHRFNKAQQDTLLPHVEAGTIILIGATTENPSFEVNRALLSRCRVVKMDPLPEENVRVLLQRAAGKEGVTVTDEALDVISRLADGDARRGLNALEEAIVRGRMRQQQQTTSTQPETGGKDSLAAAAQAEASQQEQQQQHEKEKQPVIDISCIADAGLKTHLLYDKMKDCYYDLISALHKSVRGSDEHAAVYYLARMLEAGEDPLRIGRRIVRMASEDIGLADPHALGICVAAYEAAHFTGMPECSTALAMAVIYLCHAAKSNAVYLAYNKAKELIQKHPEAPVPLHIRNAPTTLMRQLGYAKDYIYTNQPVATLPAAQCSAFRAQTYLPGSLAHIKVVPDYRPQQCHSSRR